MSTDSISYHCFVKVCSKDASGTCSKPYSFNNRACISRYSYWPRQREEVIEHTSQSAADGSTIVELTKHITIPSVAAKNCQKTLDDVCIVNENVNVNSSAGEISIVSGLICFLAFSNFLL